MSSKYHTWFQTVLDLSGVYELLECLHLCAATCRWILATWVFRWEWEWHCNNFRILQTDNNYIIVCIFHFLGAIVSTVKINGLENGCGWSWDCLKVTAHYRWIRAPCACVYNICTCDGCKHRLFAQHCFRIPFSQTFSYLGSICESCNPPVRTKNTVHTSCTFYLLHVKVVWCYNG